MALLQVVLFLMMCAVALGWVARHFKFPYPIALVIGGGALGFVPRLPQLQFDPQFLLVLVLPPILYQAALLTSWHEFKANIRPIGLLAIGLVIATTLAVGATLKLLIPDIPWSAAFVLGAIVSPPDVAAATAILSRLNIPRNVVTVLEGESLVNDASGLVIYKFAVAAVLTGVFALWQESLEFVGVAVGGVVIGFVMGRLFVFIHRYLGDAFIEVLTTLAVPYVTYIFAESLHVSGVLAVVAAGIVRGRYSPEIVSAEMRIIARSVWNLLVFLLNSLIFILIGVQLSAIVARLTDYSVGELFFYGTFVSAVAIFVRFAWVYPATYLPLVLRAMLGEQVAPPREGEVFIMGWCGMRGIGRASCRERRHPERVGRTNPCRIRRENHALGARRPGVAALGRRRRAAFEKRGGEGGAAGADPAVARKPDQRRRPAPYRGRPRLPGIAHLGWRRSHGSRSCLCAFRARRPALRGTIPRSQRDLSRELSPRRPRGHRHARRRRRDEAQVSSRHHRREQAGRRGRRRRLRPRAGEAGRVHDPAHAAVVARHRPADEPEARLQDAG